MVRQQSNWLTKVWLLRPVVDSRRYTWGRLPLQVKLRFLSPWLFLILVATCCTLASVILNFIYTKNFAPSASVQKLLIGMGCFLFWVTGLRYLQHYRTLYGFMLTINTFLPRALPFALGFVPILLGYAMLGLAAFGRSVPIFSSLRATLTTLWATTMGDSLHQVFYAVQSVNVWHALYMFTYLGLAIYVVVNIIIATVEESYFLSQEKRRWLDQFLERAMELSEGHFASVQPRPCRYDPGQPSEPRASFSSPTVSQEAPLR